ncbi:MAG TPA: 16S rRNA (uracil(1498)-N(3))-methyltransferase [Candidatus Acidoferrales bacterium]|nr:16S rRNA (uracil(1498)-N(3))-methyltransferase [Candidatus Acidoferrales bacterium]
MRRLYTENIDAARGKASVTGAEFDHLRVLRLRTGDTLLIFDGSGTEHEARIDACTDRAAELSIIRSYRPQRESLLQLTLAQCLGKGEKMDWVVEKAVELGAQKIVPLLSAYTVPRLDSDKMAKRKSRWEKIALSAAKQCGRTAVPEIAPVASFFDFIDLPWPQELKFMFWENESSRGPFEIKRDLPEARSALLLIGPEGGFAAREVQAAVGRGFRTVRLGKRILRTETAAVAALAIVQSLWGDMG